MASALNSKLLANGEEGLQDGHKSRHLAEIAAAHHLSVHCQGLLIIAGLHAPNHLMKAQEDGLRELKGRRRSG